MKKIVIVSSVCLVVGNFILNAALGILVTENRMFSYYFMHKIIPAFLYRIISCTTHLTSISLLMSFPSPDNNSFKANDQSVSRLAVDPTGELLALLKVLLLPSGLAVLLLAANISTM